ncbi:C39 family peptidase [Planomicrobium okeanokoites]|uniref:C39 family peptidase n=1 Tax=Planomicrobium okeanokoites TaxID=244 RepID=A0ABV7KMM1_PLAOK|nr:C39 family peptidase [Planomicrobium okeanokoites]TAA65652.1 hypothetical protein D2910_16415 [Planomicrobium okeanokoites]
MKKNLQLVLCLMFLLLFLILGIGTVSASEREGKTMDVKTTQETVKNFVENKQNVWGLEIADIDIKYISELRGLDEEINSYYFHVKSEGNLEGYVLASANTKFDPIFEYGTFDTNVDDYIGEKIQGNNKVAYYLGAGEIEVSTNGNELKKKLKAKKDGLVELLNNEGEYEEAARVADIPIGLESNQEVIPESEMTDGFNALAAGPKTLQVYRVYQREPGVNHPNSACGPAAGASISNYYNDYRYFNVRDSTYYGGAANFIDHLYYDMNSATWGTNAYAFANGLKLHLNHSMTGWYSVSSTTPTFSQMMTAINANYPVAMVSPYLADDTYHWRVIKGYDNLDGSYIAYVDPDGSYSGTRWSSWSTWASKIDTVYLRR